MNSILRHVKRQKRIQTHIGGISRFKKNVPRNTKMDAHGPGNPEEDSKRRPICAGDAFQFPSIRLGGAAFWILAWRAGSLHFAGGTC